ncbi:TPA: DUF4406 domain-containing protein [Citrobacter freundii]
MNLTRKVYIAGPMTNRPRFNRPAFFDAAVRLKEAGDIPLNTAVLPDGLSSADYMLNSWKGSGGAVAEYHLAFKLGLKIMTQHSVTTHNKEVSTL